VKNSTIRLILSFLGFVREIITNSSSEGIPLFIDNNSSRSAKKALISLNTNKEAEPSATIKWME
jgi:hypothetical protein